MLEYGLPLIAVGYAAIAITLTIVRSRQLDKAKAEIEEILKAERQRSLDAAMKRPDISELMAQSSRVAAAAATVAKSDLHTRRRHLVRERKVERQHA